MPGSRISRVSRVPASTIFSTWTMTVPPEFRAAWAWARVSAQTASRWKVQLPLVSA